MLIPDDPDTELTISVEAADYEDWSESHILVQDNKTTDVHITESILKKVDPDGKEKVWQFRVFSINSAWDYVDHPLRRNGTDLEFGKSRRAIGLTSNVPEDQCNQTVAKHCPATRRMSW